MLPRVDVDGPARSQASHIDIAVVVLIVQVDTARTTRDKCPGSDRTDESTSAVIAAILGSHDGDAAVAGGRGRPDGNGSLGRCIKARARHRTQRQSALAVERDIAARQEQACGVQASIGNAQLKAKPPSRNRRCIENTRTGAERKRREIGGARDRAIAQGCYRALKRQIGDGSAWRKTDMHASGHVVDVDSWLHQS